MSEENVVHLPMLYSRPSLPIPPDAIANQEDVNCWPYLKGIELPWIEAEIGLLIRSDVPEVLQPKETRESKNGSPFTTRTKLGWVIKGPLGRDKPKVPSANFVQAHTTLDQQFQEFSNREFNDSFYDSKPSMSLNDQKTLDIMEETVKLENGHYEIALPWKTYPPRLENNKALAEN